MMQMKLFYIFCLRNPNVGGLWQEEYSNLTPIMQETPQNHCAWYKGMKMKTNVLLRLNFCLFLDGFLFLMMICVVLTRGNSPVFVS